MSAAADAIATGAPTPSPAPAPSPSPTPSPTPSPSPTPTPTPTPAPSEATWQEKFLPEDLRGNETLAIYKDIPSVAKALVETKAWAGGRIAVPKADDVDGFAEFAGKVRPEKAEDYAIAVPDGQDGGTADFFRAKFFERGLHPQQAKGLAEDWNQYQADLVSKVTQAGRDEVTAVELELGPSAFTQRVTAVDNMLKAAGIEIADVVPALEQVAGAGKAMKALFALAEKTGELAKVDGATVQLKMGAMTPAQAQAEVTRMDGDAETRAKVKDKTSPEYAKREALIWRAAERA